jgi:deazaflavin-dependent oxidoreductase (nitroreductase family)
MLAPETTIRVVALPHWLTRVNLAFGNHILRPFATSLPWFGVLEHVGRRSGTVRRTPLMAFQRDGGRWIVALTYGDDVQWLKNVMASGGCRILSRRRWHTLAEPRQFTDPSRRDMPAPVRLALAGLRVDQFVELHEVESRGQLLESRDALRRIDPP